MVKEILKIFVNYLMITLGTFLIFGNLLSFFSIGSTTAGQITKLTCRSNPLFDRVEVEYIYNLNGKAYQSKGIDMFSHSGAGATVFTFGIGGLILPHK